MDTVDFILSKITTLEEKLDKIIEIITTRGEFKPTRHSEKDKIYKIISDNCGIYKMDLTRKTQWLNKSQRNSLINQLIDEQKIQVQTRARASYFFPLSK